ncbi:MAG: hypothetical protein LC114_03550 [Bryobacterales bacterium]|nr:hypothetical protein [Bryobacterales bacterium]
MRTALPWSSVWCGTSSLEGAIVALNDKSEGLLLVGLPTVEQVFARTAIDQGFLTLVLLAKGRRCQGPRGMCTVFRALPNGDGGCHAYEVAYEDGSTVVCCESELEPVPATTLPTPSLRLATREIDHLLQFRTREVFRSTCAQNLCQGGSCGFVGSAR